MKHGRAWAWLSPILLLAPLELGAKGCNGAVVGDDCAEGSKSAHCAASGGDANSGGKSSTGGVANKGGSAGTGGKGGTGGEPASGGKGGTGGKSGTGGSAGEGTVCGGFSTNKCGTGEFCNYPLDAQCGAADQTGVCEPIPPACDAILRPVCGCDGTTYSSSCEAALRGVSVSTEGECATKACGGEIQMSCDADQYCEYAPEAHCGAADEPGHCAKLPDCASDTQPVCGCDGTTYRNACVATAAGTAVAAQGACAPLSDDSSVAVTLMSLRREAGQLELDIKSTLPLYNIWFPDCGLAPKVYKKSGGSWVDLEDERPEFGSQEPYFVDDTLKTNCSLGCDGGFSCSDLPLGATLTLPTQEYTVVGTRNPPPHLDTCVTGDPVPLLTSTDTEGPYKVELRYFLAGTCPTGAVKSKTWIVAVD